MVRYIILFLLFLSFSACNRGSEIVYPPGGYDYPTNLKDSDTTFYCYPIKDSLSRRDSMYEATSYFFFQPYDEPNLSIRPLESDVFRFYYSSWMEPDVIIILTKNKIVVKSGSLEGAFVYDTSKLTAQENRDYVFLTNTFPLDTTHLSSRGKAYYDSVFREHPKLYDVNYLLELKKKIHTPLKRPFQYEISVIPISDTLYKDLVTTINKSGFWNLPFKIDCETFSTDGGGFQLEANTKNKYKTVSTNVCPDNESAFLKACEKLVKAAGVKGVSLTFSGVTESISDSVR